MLRFLRSAAILLAAIVILFEEWLWDPLKRVMQALSRLPFIRHLSMAISKLPPRAAAFVYLGPMIVLLPFKITGLWLVAQHHALLGLVIFLSAKLVGTALFTWLFGLTKPALMQIVWFARLYFTVRLISTTAHAWIHRQLVYQWVRAMAREVRIRIGRMLKS